MKIQLSNGSGKACAGCAKTKTLQVISEGAGGSYQLLKSFRFINGDEESMRKAYAKAHKFVEATK